jgi:hypothetical protein
VVDQAAGGVAHVDASAREAAAAQVECVRADLEGVGERGGEGGETVHIGHAGSEGGVGDAQSGEELQGGRDVDALAEKLGIGVREDGAYAAGGDGNDLPGNVDDEFIADPDARRILPNGSNKGLGTNRLVGDVAEVEFPAHRVE